jgi:hypothetical protein
LEGGGVEVEVAEAASAHGGGAALGAIDLDVLTTSDTFHI